MSERSERCFHLTGWLLFLACAILFTVDASLNGSVLGILAGGLFLAGCIAFLVPLVRSTFLRKEGGS